MVLGSNKTVQATIALMAACGVSRINDAQRIRRPTGRWKPRLLCVCGSHTGCLQAESVLPGWWPAGGRGQCVYACHMALESSMAQTDARSGTDRRFRLLV